MNLFARRAYNRDYITCFERCEYSTVLWPYAAPPSREFELSPLARRRGRDLLLEGGRQLCPDLGPGDDGRLGAVVIDGLLVAVRAALLLIVSSIAAASRTGPPDRLSAPARRPRRRSRIEGSRISAEACAAPNREPVRPTCKQYRRHRKGQKVPARRR